MNFRNNKNHKDEHSDSQIIYYNIAQKKLENSPKISGHGQYKSLNKK